MATSDVIVNQQEQAVGGWVKVGAVGGLVAGVVFAMFEMIMAAILNGADAFFMPLRMIGATVLGQEALTPSYSLGYAAVTGVIVHMVLSMMFGVVFALITEAAGLVRSTGVLFVAASLYGLSLWLVNFYLIAPVVGWDWFPNGTEVWVQLVAHTLFFGTVLGLLLDRLVTGRRAQ